MQIIDFSEFDKMFINAQNHYLKHSCGGAPYKYYKKLYSELQLLNNENNNFLDLKDLKILEIGTATGLMTFFLARLFPNALVDSLEMEKLHINLANEFISSNLLTDKIKIIHCDANSFMQYSKNNYYDLIFFDGFAPEEELLNKYEKILKQNGILISTNSHLSQSKTNNYFNRLSDLNKWINVVSFEDTIIYKKIF